MHPDPEPSPLWRYLLDRAREPSTWRGLILILSAAGTQVSPNQAESIIAAGIALAGIVGAFVADPRA